MARVKNMPRRQQKAVFASRNRSNSGKLTKKEKDKIVAREFKASKPYSTPRERADWNAFNFAITKTRQYQKHRDKGDRPRTARNKAMKDLGIKPDPKKYPDRKWYDLNYLPARQQVVARRYKKRIYKE